MKRLFLSSLLLGVMVSTFAQSKELVVHQKSGEQTVYAFSEQPKVTSQGSTLLITTTNVQVEYPMENFVKFTFQDKYVDAVELVVTTGKQTGSTRVYDVSGKLVSTVEATDGITQFATDQLPKGIYIIKSSSVTYKIIKK